VAPQVEAEAHATSTDPGAVAVDAAHVLAFRTGLGNPLLASSHNGITVEDVKAFAAQAFTKENVAIVGSGVQDAVLTQLVQKSLKGLPSGTTSSPPTKYHGGESRISAHTLPTVYIGFGTSTPTPSLAVLASYLDPTPSLKWSKGLSPLSNLPAGASIRVVYDAYSDGALLGLLVQGPSAEVVKEAGKIAVKALKDAGAGAIKSDALTRALSRAKFSAASAVEGREGLTAAVASQV
jgi:ubiquinol-cytochrome c reductase core subunit 2